jgi:ParB family chromosome partitioning protein
MGDLRNVPLSSIRENPVALRTVNRTSEEYLGLVQSIRQKGFFGAITVRCKTDPETGQEYFELVDGLHRFSASKDAGLTDISVDVTKLNDDAVLEAQLMANIHKVETRPVEYSQQLRRILARNPLMTEAELADRLGKSAAWIGQRLGLTRITNSEIQRLVNEGKIPLSNAYAMAKLPSEEMAQFVDRAMTEGADKFFPPSTSASRS